MPRIAEANISLAFLDSSPMMRFFSVLAFALLLCASCVGPSLDATRNALAANESMRQTFFAQSRAFKTIIEKAQLDDLLRDRILEMLERDEQNFTTTSTALAAYIAAVGELSPDQLDRILNELLDIYERLSGGTPTVNERPSNNGGTEVPGTSSVSPLDETESHA